LGNDIGGGIIRAMIDLSIWNVLVNRMSHGPWRSSLQAATCSLRIATWNEFVRLLIHVELELARHRQYAEWINVFRRKEHSMKLTRLLPILALSLALAACGGSAASQAPSISQSEAAPPAAAPVAPGQSAGGGATALDQGNAPASEQAPGAQQDVQRLVIKTADLSLQVDSARDAEASLRTLVGQLGGYVVKVETSGTDESMSSHVIFRVPAERFDQALTGVQGLAKKVLARTVGGDDVTEEFVDLESRLKNLEATRDRLQSFLDKAENVDDALKVNQSLSDLQGQIEQLKGRKQFLERSAALSTISVTLSPLPTIAPIVEDEGWQPLGVARDALRELVSFGQGLATLVIVALVWAPVWLPLILFGLWLTRRLRRRVAPAKAPEAA
jgi:hypothetical protein